MAMGATSGGASPTGTERVYVDLANRDLTNDGTSDARHPYDPILGNPAWRPVRSADGRAAWRARQFAKARGDYRRHAAFAEQNSQAQRRGASGESAGGVTAASQISSHGVSGASQISSHGVSGGLSGGVHPSSATPRGSSATPRGSSATPRGSSATSRRSTPRAKSATPRSTAKQPTPRRSAQDSARRRSASPRSARSGQSSSAAMDAQYSARTAQGSARASGFGSARMGAQDSARAVQARSVMPGYTGHVARSRDVFFQSWHTPEVHAVATGKQTGAEEAVELGGGTTSGLYRVGEALSTRKGPAGPTCTTGIEAPFGKAEHPGIEAPFGKAEHPASYSCFMPKTSNVVEGTPIALPTPTAFPTATRILSAKRDPSRLPRTHARVTGMSTSHRLGSPRPLCSYKPPTPSYHAFDTSMPRRPRARLIGLHHDPPYPAPRLRCRHHPLLPPTSLRHLVRVSSLANKVVKLLSLLLCKALARRRHLDGMLHIELNRTPV